jgi:t-SNARE complex subunit (syntaxin)
MVTQNQRNADIDCEQLGEDLDKESREALQKYQSEIDAISQAINKIQETITQVEERYQASLSEKVSAEEKKRSQSEIARMLQENEKRSEAIRKRLRRIAGENKTFATEFPTKTGQLQVRVNTHQGLTKRFMAAMQSFEKAQEKHRDNVRSAMERQLKLMTGASQEDIREAMRNGQTDNFVENSPMMMQLPPEEQRKLRNGLADLKSRNIDIKKLEESIVLLHQLFMDMQILVESQG